jgi:hypothetical protein
VKKDTAYLFLGFWFYALVTGLLFQLWLLPATPWHAGDGLLAGGDWISFHQDALKLSSLINQKGWSQWEVRFNGQAPASYAAAFYTLTGIFKPWVLLPINGLLYALSVVVAFMISSSLGVSRGFIYLSLIPFVFPSSILIFGQLHKDIFSLLGVLLISLASVVVLSSESIKWQRWPVILSWSSLGLLLCWWPRPYQAKLLIGTMGLLWFFILILSLLKRKWRMVRGFSAVFISLILVFFLLERVTRPAVINNTPASNSNSSNDLMATPVSPQCSSWNPEIYIPVLDELSSSVMCYRHGFIGYYTNAAGNIDYDHLITNYAEALSYLLRALQVGLFSPFPEHWFAKETTSPGGQFKRLLSSFEMIWTYIAFLGLFGIFLIDRQTRLSVASILCLALVGILFYVYTSPNIGAIYRYRFPFLVLLVIASFVGWSFILNYKKRYTSGLKQF